MGSDLKCGVDAPVPAELPVGAGTCLFLSGWCYHPVARVAAHELTVGDGAFPTEFGHLPRPRHYASSTDDCDPKGHALCSGFADFIRLPAFHAPTPHGPPAKSF